jgi:hypothetical protein
MIMPKLIINTYASLMYELKKNNWEGTDEEICWDWALALWKKNLPGRGLTKVEKHCYTYFVLKNILYLHCVNIKI